MLRSIPRIAGAAGAITTLLAVAACGSSSSNGNGGSSSGTTVTVTAADFSFSPTQLSVPAGATVTVDLKNNGSTQHSFTLDNGGADVSAGAGGSTTVTFSAPQSGTLSFHCKFHPTRMKGTITVGSGGGGGAGSSSSTSSSSSSNGYGY